MNKLKQINQNTVTFVPIDNDTYQLYVREYDDGIKRDLFTSNHLFVENIVGNIRNDYVDDIVTGKRRQNKTSFYNRVDDNQYLFDRPENSVDSRDTAYQSMSKLRSGDKGGIWKLSDNPTIREKQLEYIESDHNFWIEDGSVVEGDVLFDGTNYIGFNSHISNEANDLPMYFKDTTLYNAEIIRPEACKYYELSYPQKKLAAFQKNVFGLNNVGVFGSRITDMSNSTLTGPVGLAGHKAYIYNTAIGFSTLEVGSKGCDIQNSWLADTDVRGYVNLQRFHLDMNKVPFSPDSTLEEYAYSLCEHDGRIMGRNFIMDCKLSNMRIDRHEYNRREFESFKLGFDVSHIFINTELDEGNVFPKNHDLVRVNVVENGIQVLSNDIRDYRAITDDYVDPDEVYSIMSAKGLNTELETRAMYMPTSEKDLEYRFQFKPLFDPRSEFHFITPKRYQMLTKFIDTGDIGNTMDPNSPFPGMNSLADVKMERYSIDNRRRYANYLYREAIKENPDVEYTWVPPFVVDPNKPDEPKKRVEPVESIFKRWDAFAAEIKAQEDLKYQNEQSFEHMSESEQDSYMDVLHEEVDDTEANYTDVENVVYAWGKPSVKPVQKQPEIVKENKKLSKTSEFSLLDGL